MSSNKEIERAEKLENSGQIAEAARILRDVIAKNNQDFAANYALGMLYRRAGRNDLSIPLLKKAVQVGPGVFKAVLNLGIMERLQGMSDDALIHLERAASLKPDSAEAYASLGLVHLDRNDIDTAIKTFARALAIEPNSPETNTQMGLVYGIRGEPREAARYYRNAISHNPHCGHAHYSLAFNQRFEEYSDDVLTMEQAFHSPDISDDNRMLVGFALGKVFDDLAKYDKAFEYVRAANELQRISIEFSIDRQKEIFDRHKQALGHDFIEHCKHNSVADDTPILILGMPRSGTSLVEQILASHPSVHGAGEVEYSRLFEEQVRKLTGRPFPENIGTIAPEKLSDLALGYIGKLKTTAGSAKYVTDKLPHNFLRVGLFAALMPNAKVLACDRDPLDNCVSIYQHRFSAYHGYACMLTELGEYYKLYEALMSFWEKLLPGHIHRVSYESLVENTEAEIRSLLEFCGIPFDDNCLKFHKTERLVNTPSAPQVREPIYSDATRRARNYERHLQPLVEALA